MKGQLEGKRALVTGSSSGIGKAIARRFAIEGALVAAHARAPEAADQLAQELSTPGVRVVPVHADLSDNKAIATMCDAAVGELNGLDILINNAGICEKGGISDAPEKLWFDTIQINLTAPYLISRYVAPALIASGEGASIIFNASISAELADPKGSAYCASKAGLTGLMRCLAAELGPKGVRVNAMCPGWVDTPLAQRCHDAMFPDDSQNFDEFYDRSLRQNMINSRLRNEDVADLAVFLASSNSRHMTAQSINLCGGTCPS